MSTVSNEKQNRANRTSSIALEQANSLISAILESTTEGFLVMDLEGQILRFNRQFINMWHISAAVLEEGHEKVLSHMLASLKDPHRHMGELQAGCEETSRATFDVLELKDGRIFERHSHPQWIQSKKVGQVWSFRDATERHHQATQLQHRALYDVLTDLPNRTLLQDRLQQAILQGRRTMENFAILLMDLDRFKDINDTLGHRVGDLLLKKVGSRVASVLGNSDTLARLGGDEFAVLLQGPVSETEAVAVARRIHSVLLEPFLVEDLNLDIDASIGVALFPEHGDQVHTLLKRADIAMYMAKKSENRVMVYSSSEDAYSFQKLVLKSDLKHAIDNNELFVLYQPKVNIKEINFEGVEALVRWKHPQFGIVMPDDFIGLAEQTGLIKPITAWVLKTALLQQIAWRNQGLELIVAVNLSVRSLLDPNLVDEVMTIIQENDGDPKNIILEITESTIMEDPIRAMDIVTRLNDKGIRFALDDFGTGYSSLSYLRRLPIQTLKIDKSFITEMCKEADDEVIVLSVIELAHNLGMRVVAEGIEDLETWHRLRALDCDEAQGYFLSRPISGDKILEWNQTWQEKISVPSEP